MNNYTKMMTYFNVAEDMIASTLALHEKSNHWTWFTYGKEVKFEADYVSDASISKSTMWTIRKRQHQR